MSHKIIVDGLKKVLADTFLLYFKTHSFHWNVEGAQFKALHDLFMEQYTELWNTTDLIAERIRTLGEYAPNSWEDMMKHVTLQETGQTPDHHAMIEMLANDNKAITDVIRPVLHDAQKGSDDVTADLMTQRLAVHEKTLWMLNSLLKNAA
ncbi:MAG: DNA starvation/stationary phase protection protein [Alphaproteobacteria bacterium CG_4_9_14_3_um_filter_47_13]|nr:MAG: DNA starvation/stationary phase protection protein [Alphaproteobacteria bacterium CG_4_9_14_3_um_filter_47_13]